MAYIEGLVSKEELIKLVKRGWEPEPATEEDKETYGTKDIWVQFYVDVDVLDVMSGARLGRR